MGKVTQNEGSCLLDDYRIREKQMQMLDLQWNEIMFAGFPTRYVNSDFENSEVIV